MSKPVFPLRLRIIAALGPTASLLALVLRWCVIQKDDPDFNLTLVNYAVAWLPFGISILVAFVPDMRRAHIAWRLLIILAGLTYSVLLFKQQYLAMEASKRDQATAITTAVKESNKHADEQIGGVRNELKGQGTKINERLDTLESHLTSSIGKVKPLPPKFAQLQFSFYTPEEGRFPLLYQSLRAHSDGLFEMEVWLKNISDEVAAEKGDIWMAICSECRYVPEPAGFQRLSESPEPIRHKTFEIINHGIFLEPWKVSISVPVKFSSFDISFRYECQTCGPGKHEIQTLKVYVLPTPILSNPRPKPKPKPY